MMRMLRTNHGQGEFFQVSDAPLRAVSHLR
jgi:hypothetical protein